MSAAQAQLRVEPVAPFGARVSGIDLSMPCGDARFAQVRRLFEQYHLLVFPGQQLDQARLGAFASCFGELDPVVKKEANDGSTRAAVHTVSNLNPQGQPTVSPVINANYWWHTDRAYRPNGSLLTMLHGVEIPGEGGDTHFANMILALAALPAETRERIEGLRVTHSYEFMRETIMKLPATEAERKDAPPVVHGITRVHPVTGEKSLFIGMYACEVAGMPAEEGRALLRTLEAHATQERFVYAHKWAPGDLVVWDNRCLLHKATSNYDMGKERRVMLRVVVRDTAEF